MSRLTLGYSAPLVGSATNRPAVCLWESDLPILSFGFPVCSTAEVTDPFQGCCKNERTFKAMTETGLEVIWRR